MRVGHISPVMTAPVVPVPAAAGGRASGGFGHGNTGIVPPWLTGPANPITILPWPLPDGSDASASASWSNN